MSNHIETPVAVVLRNIADKASLLNQLRKCDTFGEMALTIALWRARDGWNVVTQHPLRGYRVDIVIPEVQMCIEVDGGAGHGTEEQRAADVVRQRNIEADGWNFVRVTAADAFMHPGECAVAIVEAVGAYLARPVPMSRSDQLVAAIENTESVIAKIEAHLSIANQGRPGIQCETVAALLDSHRLRLQNYKAQQSFNAIGGHTFEEELEHLRAVQDRARKRLGVRSDA